MPQKLRCEVTEILDHGGGVYSIFMKPETQAPVFLPGQFLRLALDVYAPGNIWPDSRSFSIASAPSERHLLSITYAVKGRYTGRMEKELRPRSQVWIMMPYGELIVQTDREVCLLAGGTGVTAFTAFLSGLPPEHTYLVHFFYGARRPDLLIYRPSVEAAAHRCPALRVHFLAEHDAELAGCLTGRITPNAIFEWVPNPLEVDYYLAGPPGMLQTLTPGLQERGVAAGRIITDIFGDDYGI